MFSLLHKVPPKTIALEYAPPLGASLVIAELFFKFQSFSLECVAFLVTWYVLDTLLQRLVHR